MVDGENGAGWWLASDGQWYPPEARPADYPIEPAATGFPAGTTYPPIAMPDLGPPPVARRGRRRPVILTAASVVLVAVIATVVVATNGGTTNADAAVIRAVDTAIAGKTATVTATGSVVAAGTTAAFSGSGSVDFTNSAMSLNLTADAAGQHFNEQAIYLAGIVYEGLPQISQLAPGKSWASVDLSSLTQAAGQSGTGLGGDPLAMLHALALQGNSVTDGGSTTLDGQPVHEYSVTFNPAVIQQEIDSAKLPAWLKQSVSQVTVHSGSEKVYVDDSAQLAGLSYAVDETAGNAGSVTVNESLGFSNYGTPVTISAPPADATIPLSQLVKLAG